MQYHLTYRLKEAIQMASLAEIRAKLQESQNKAPGSSSGGGDNAIYPHWNMQEGKEAVVRFLPDGNSNNTFFWVERAMIKLPFAGIKGESDSRAVQVQVPCVEMYNDGSTCPILSEVRGWFKDKSLEEMGRKYWKKRSYIFQGFIVDDPLKEESTPNNPIRRFIIGPQIYQIIRSALMDPELEDLPTDSLRGVDFRIAKTSKGGYADYSTSKWSRRERALSAEEQAAIDQYSLFDLSSFLPKKPTDVELKVMKEMFEASVDGEAYDMERWGQYFKPAGMSSATGDPNKSVTKPVAATVVADDDIPFEADPPKPTPVASSSESGENSSRAQDILKAIRSRQGQ
jgi:hypothetical protein